MFPDAKTERGQKHLRELIAIAQQGQQAVIFFAVLHTGITQFEVAKQIDPKYAELFNQAHQNGVLALSYKAAIELVQGVPVAMNLQNSIKI